MDIDQSLLKSSPLQPLVDSLLLGSLPKHPLDILNTDPHPSDLTLALFSAKVYTQEKSVATAAKSLSDWEMLDEPEGGWRLLTTGSNSDLTNGYFGAAYVNTGLQQVVVSHRGTVPSLRAPGPLITDVFGICWKQYMACTNSAVTFVELIRQVIFNVNTQHGRRYNLVITGHSLGGWLAQITAFTVKCLKESSGKLMKNTSGGVHAKAVVFDSPGVKTMLNKIKDDYYDRHTTNILDRLDIRVYVSAPNRINTCGAHLGTVYRVIIDVKNFNKSDRKTLLYNTTTHGIDNFMNAFRKNLDIHEIFDWPKNRGEFVKLFGKCELNHGNSYHKDLGKEAIELPLCKKTQRYNTDSSGLLSDKKIMLKCYLKIFSDNELHVLNQLASIQKHQSTNDVIKKFVSDKKLKFEDGKLFFPDFEIDHSNQTITCKPNRLIIEFANRLKQVMRWFETDFTEIVRKQVADLPLAFDSVYRAVGQSFVDSIPKSLLNFKDSLHLQDFLLLNTARVLSVVTKDGAFEIIRLLNIFSRIRESIDSSHPINKYTNESHYTVVDWPRLQTLLQIDGLPIYQNNLMIVDGTSSSTVCSDLRSFFNNYNVQCSPNNFKKLVFISSHAIDVFNSFENIYVHAFIAEHQINLLNLNDQSQECVLSRNFISTGNEVHNFNNLLDKNFSIEEINQFIHSDIFKEIACDKDYIFEIKDTRPLIQDLQMPFIKTNIETSKEHVFNCANLLNTLVVISGLSRGDLETWAAREQLEEKIILAEGDTELFFKDICDKNQRNTIYLFEVSGDTRTDIYCKQIFNRDFYIPRKFIHRMSINLQYFTEKMLADDMFFICSEEQKTSLLGMIEECTKKKVLEKVLHIAAKEREVDIMQKYSDKNIHFVRLNESKNLNERGVLEWRFSHGSVENLRPYVSLDSFEAIDELTLSQTERKLVIITDEPGMGKTTSLASLSRHIGTGWVIYIELKQFKAHIDKLPDQLNPQNVARFILSECCTGADSDLAHGLLDNLLQSKTGSRRVVLMFDGFDEMDDYTKDKESSKDKLIKVFAFLQSKPTIQIFLTSRKYLKESLETNLSQFSTAFVIISLQEQQDFLFKFWRSFLPIELGINLEVLEKRLEEYAAEVLRRAKLVLGPDMDCFMGIPLQLRMLAEVFRPQSDLLFQSLEDLFEKIDIVSASNLYKKFISQKYNIYLHDKTLIGQVLDEDDLNEKYLEPLTKDHGELAFKTFFSDFYKYLILNNYCKATTDQKLVKLSRVGLIQSLGNGEFRFIHRTYAEYCCAKMVVQWINQPDSTFKHQLIKNVLLPQILLHPDSKVIRIFINVELGEIPILNTQHIISKLWLEDSVIFRDHKHQTALHIAVQEENEHIVAFLVSGLSPLKESSPEEYVSFFAQQDFNCRTALDNILVDMPNSFNIESNSSSNRIVTNILQSIETCGHQTREIFIFAFLFQSDKSCISNYFRERESSNFSRASERFKKVCLLINPFINAVRDNDVKVVKEILSKLLNNNIERYCVLLLEHKDDKDDEDDEDDKDDKDDKDDEDEDHGNKTALQLAAKRGHLDMIHLLAEQTSVPLFNVLMARCDDIGRNPLHTAARYGHLDIVKFFKECGADINIRCKLCNTALMFAATNGHILTVEFLVKNGADIKPVDKYGSTSLHCAALVGNLSVLELLVKNGGDMKSTNNSGDTVLHSAAFGGNLSVIEYLVKKGADVKSINSDGETVLHSAVQGGNLSVTEYLVKNGGDIKSTNNSGDTVLHNAVLGGNLLVIEYLVTNGADIKSINNDGDTVLLRAVQGGNLSVIEYLVKNGADINTTYNNGTTVLHTAAWYGHLPIVKYLLQLGANPDRLNKEFWTPLTGTSYWKKWDVMRALLDWKVNVNADGGLALSFAIKWGEWSIVKSLVDKQASVKESVIEKNLSEFKNKFPDYEFRTE